MSDVFCGVCLCVVHQYDFYTRTGNNIFVDSQKLAARLFLQLISEFGEVDGKIDFEFRVLCIIKSFVSFRPIFRCSVACSVSN